MERSEAFAELALPLMDSLYNFACWLTHDRVEAEDLVQETFAKALAGFSSFTPGTNFRAWIFRILRNTFFNSVSGLASMRTVSWDENAESVAEIVHASDDTPESILLQGSNQEAIRAAIENLAVPFREVLLLADVEEMSYREISEALGIPSGTVMSRLARARKILRESLREKVVRT